MKLVCLAFFSALVLAGCAATAPPAVAPPALVTPAIITAQPLQLQVGKSQFEFVDKRGDATRPVKVWMFVPESCDTKCPLQFVMHGVKRNGEEYLDTWVGFAKEKRFIVVTPEFSSPYFPSDDDYSLGRSTTEADPSKWAFAVPEHLFDELKSRYGFTAESYRLFGHSAGGQFVHRLHLFYPQHRASPIIAANAGWYTEFEWGLLFAPQYKFPYNTSGSPIDEARSKAALSRPFVLMLGDLDTDANDPDLNKSAGANATGLNRYARGQRFFENARRASQRLNVSFPWQLQVVRGVAHNHSGMAAAAIKLMYPDSK